MRSAILNVENDNVLDGMRAFLGDLLKKGVVEAVLVPLPLPGSNGYAQSLVRDPERLQKAHPMAPTMAVQSAHPVSALTKPPARDRVAAVLKPCELRAVVELAKFLQVDLEKVLTIGVDCAGTYEVKDFAEQAGPEREAAAAGLVEAAIKGQSVEGPVREACRVCEYPVAVNADISLGLMGANGGKEIAVIARDGIDAELSEKLKLDFGDTLPAGREAAVMVAADTRGKARRGALADMEERISGLDKLMETLSTCIRCHNCMHVCPICYCQECVFESAVFEHRADKFLKWADRKGALRMPTDTIMFHLTRLSHMATSCVSCGMCDSACPSKLPISNLFALMGGQLQAMFEYVPGRDAAEEPPVSAFKEDELQVESGADD